MSGYRKPTGPTPSAARTGRDWHDDGLCAKKVDGRPVHDPELWHLPGPNAEHAAKEICGDCPVRKLCKAEAVATPTLTGVWGGTTDDERKALRSRKRPATHDPRCGTYSGANRHRRDREEMCGPCREAQREYDADYKARKRASA